MLSGPNRAPNATCWAGVSVWSRKKITWWSSRAWRICAIAASLAPFLGAHRGRNEFEGFKTERVYTLVARGKVFEDLATDPRLMALISRFLEGNFLLSATHAINLTPGETAQGIHTDDGF